jgi:hypothetical protein
VRELERLLLRARMEGDIAIGILCSGIEFKPGGEAALHMAITQQASKDMSQPGQADRKGTAAGRGIGERFRRAAADRELNPPGTVAVLVNKRPELRAQAISQKA